VTVKVVAAPLAISKSAIALAGSRGAENQGDGAVGAECERAGAIVGEAEIGRVGSGERN